MVPMYQRHHMIIQALGMRKLCFLPQNQVGSLSIKYVIRSYCSKVNANNSHLRHVDSIADYLSLPPSSPRTVASDKILDPLRLRAGQLPRMQPDIQKSAKHDQRGSVRIAYLQSMTDKVASRKMKRHSDSKS